MHVTEADGGYAFGADTSTDPQNEEKQEEKPLHSFFPRDREIIRFPAGRREREEYCRWSEKAIYREHFTEEYIS